MVRDVVGIFEHQFNPQTLMLGIPNAFDHLKGSDTNFEMVTSNTIQDTQMEYKNNLITQSEAVIFINTHCNKVRDLSEQEQNKILADTLAKKARSLDRDILKFSKSLGANLNNISVKTIEALSPGER